MNRDVHPYFNRHHPAAHRAAGAHGIAALLCALGLLAAGASGTAGAADADPALPGMEVVDNTELAALRGRAGDSRITVQSNQDLSATVNGSTIQAGSMLSGAVTIEQHAMDNFSGVGLFNIVTGSNNAVDAAIGVNFNLQ